MRPGVDGLDFAHTGGCSLGCRLRLRGRPFRHHQRPQLGIRRQHAMVEAFSHALRARLLEGGAGFPKRYLRHFVTDIRFDGKRETMTGRKAALLEAVAEKEMGTARVPTSSCRWLPDQGSNLGPAD